MLENTVNYYESTLFKLEQLLRARSHQVGRGRAAENAEDTLIQQRVKLAQQMPRLHKNSAPLFAKGLMHAHVRTSYP